MIYYFIRPEDQIDYAGEAQHMEIWAGSEKSAEKALRNMDHIKPNTLEIVMIELIKSSSDLEKMKGKLNVKSR